MATILDSTVQKFSIWYQDQKMADSRAHVTSDQQYYNRQARAAVLELSLAINNRTATSGIVNEKRHNPINYKGGTVCRSPKMRFWSV